MSALASPGFFSKPQFAIYIELQKSRCTLWTNCYAPCLSKLPTSQSRPRRRCPAFAVRGLRPAAIATDAFGGRQTTNRFCDCRSYYPWPRHGEPHRCPCRSCYRLYFWRPRVQMTQIQQGEAEVVVTAIVTVAYYLLSWNRRRDCDAKILGWMAVNALGGVTGVFIFVGCFDVMKLSVLNGVWSGIAGIVITLATMTEIIKQFAGLWTQKIQATKDE